jgi:hypothetical protein
MRVPLSAGFSCFDYYISTRLSGEIEKKSAIRKNPNDTVRRETENPEWILETVVSHYMLFIGPRQISRAADYFALSVMFPVVFSSTLTKSVYSPG